jgi:hypothetical protein
MTAALMLARQRLRSKPVAEEGLLAVTEGFERHTIRSLFI